MAEFCSARSETIPPLPWTNFAPPFPPAINEARCTGCAMCREACIVDPKAAAVSALVPDEEDQAAARTQNSMI